MPRGAIGLLGPNGAGKSTLLKTIMGFIPPVRGTALVFGHDCARQGAEVRQRIGYMPEEDTYIPGMSAVEFVSYCGLLCGLPAKEAMLRAHQVLHYCGLGEARYRKVDTYSTGMRQRIKLAQALVHDPDLLFLDEPTNGLDPLGRKAMLDLIHDVTHNKEISVILSSHLLPDVEMVCDHVMVLFQGNGTSGRIRISSSGAEIYIVRLKGDTEPFVKVLGERGIAISPKRDGFCGSSDEKPGYRRHFRGRARRRTQIRHITREEMTLKKCSPRPFIRPTAITKITPHRGLRKKPPCQSVNKPPLRRRLPAADADLDDHRRPGRPPCLASEMVQSGAAFRPASVCRQGCNLPLREPGIVAVDGFPNQLGSKILTINDEFYLNFYTRRCSRVFDHLDRRGGSDPSDRRTGAHPLPLQTHHAAGLPVRQGAVALTYLYSVTLIPALLLVFLYAFSMRTGAICGSSGF